MKNKPLRLRLDKLLVERGLAESVSQAAAMVLAGEVQVVGKTAQKAGMPVAQDARIEITSRRQKYVSRAGLKLEGALEDFSIDPSGRICLDIGSSHGGFTDCLLQRGAASVYAVDVNVEQLDWKLRRDARVIPIKRNAKELRERDVAELVDLAVVDVSFISVGRVLGPASKLAKAGAHFLILVKPQFELPRGKIAAGGVVSDKHLHQEAVSAVQKQAQGVGLECLGVRPSRLTGAEGNQEYFLHARKKALE
jgi:23S rRNA (cytidine1920-2'-O)/16S rRNA (cytidine1409-2'-O)-methyltransferase